MPVGDAGARRAARVGAPGTRPGWTRPRPRGAALLLGAVVALHLLIATAPFRLDPPRRVDNGAHLAAGALRIDGPAAARTVHPPAWLRETARTGSFEIRLRARADGPTGGRLARIVAVERDYTDADVVIGQWDRALVVRVRRAGSDAAGHPAVRVDDVFDDDEHDIGVVADGTVMEITVDGVVASRRALAPDAFAGWSTDHRLHVGDAARGDRTWAGEVRGLVAGAGGDVVDYLAPGALELPARLWVVPDRLDGLLGLEVDDRRGATMAAVHALSFVPVGVLAFLAAATGRAPRWRALAVVAGSGVSLQVAKVFVAGRHPGLVDLVVAVVGGAAGIAAEAAVTARSPAATVSARGSPGPGCRPR